MPQDSHHLHDNQPFQKAEYSTLHLRSEEVQDILTAPPSSIVRRGSMVILGVVMILLALSWFIHYPDIVPSTIKLSADNPPIRVLAPNSGLIDQILVSENQKVTQGQRLIILESTARIKDIDSLNYTIDRMLSTPVETYTPGMLPKGISIGELQTAYSELAKNISDFHVFTQTDIAAKTRRNLFQQIRQYEQINNTIKEQEGLLTQELIIAKSDKARYEKLFSDGTASKADLESREAAVLRLESQIRNLKVTFDSNELQKTEILRQIEDEESGKSTDFVTKTALITESLRTLKAEINSWYKMFVITAPTVGEVVFNKKYSIRQAVNSGEELLTVVPDKQNGEIYGIILLEGIRSGKVDTGQKVNIKLEAYPYQEFGMLRGTIQNISSSPDEQGIKKVTVILDKGMESSHKQTLPFRQEMKGSAEIITRNRRFIHRVFDKLSMEH